MPIKFRCHHCKQLLGISQGKAGEAVDCPTCGRSIRVPKPGDKSRPISEPEWDREDSSLVRALDELAAIGQEPESGPVVFGELPDSPDDEPMHGAPARVVLEPLLPAVPVAMPAPLPPAAVLPVRTSAKGGSSVGGVSGANRGIVSNEPTFGAHSIGSPVRESDLSRGRPLSVARGGAPLLVGGGVLIACSLFAAGYAMGLKRGRGANNEVAGPQPSATAKQAASSPSSGGQASAPSLKGRITYVNSSGEGRPDRGARILVFPADRKGTVRLSTAGFRPADSDADFKIAAAGLMALGGNASVAEEDGSFQIPLPGAGEYQVLVISHYQSRDADEKPTEKLRTLLERFFERPDQLLGRLAYHAASIRHKGAGTDIWDYSFTRG